MELSDANANLLLICDNGSGLHALCKAFFNWKKNVQHVIAWLKLTMFIWNNHLNFSPIQLVL